MYLDISLTEDISPDPFSVGRHWISLNSYATQRVPSESKGEGFGTHIPWVANCIYDC